MKNNTDKHKKDEYVVPFVDVKLNKHQANQAGFGLLSGILGVLFAVILFGKDQKIYSLIVIGFFLVIGFFGYGYLKKNKK